MKTTITIRKETYYKLQKFGKMGQSFDDLINELLKKLGTINHE